MVSVGGVVPSRCGQRGCWAVGGGRRGGGSCHGILGCGGYLGRRGGEDVRGGPSSEAVGDREDPPAKEIENKGDWNI